MPQWATISVLVDKQAGVLRLSANGQQSAVPLVSVPPEVRAVAKAALQAQAAEIQDGIGVLDAPPLVK